MALFSTSPCSSSIRRLGAAALFSAFLPLSLFSQALVWDDEVQTFDADFGQEKVETVYRFTNESDSIVTIKEAKASCGCTVPSLEKKVYEPGESGELQVIFNLGSRQGQQHKTIRVDTEEQGKQQEYKLALEVDIPVPVTLTPRVRFWTVGEEAQTQDVEISFNSARPMQLDGLKRKDEHGPDAFDYEIETVAEGSQYRLRITPKTPEKKSRDVFFLQSEDDQDGILRNFPIYVYVR